MIIILSGCSSQAKEKSYEVFERDDFTVIKTKAENIKPETIRSPLCSDYVRELGYYGINAGFFNSVYKEKPNDEDFISVSISWSREDSEKGAEVFEYSPRDFERVALGEDYYISRGTLYLYEDDGRFEAGVISAESCYNLKMKVKSRKGIEHDFIYMIGGGNFYINEYPDIDDWESWKQEKYAAEGPLVVETNKTGRSGIGIKEENGEFYAYLAVSGTNGEEKPKTLRELRDLFISLGCSDAIYLDGDGSSQMRCEDDNGELIEKPGDNRYIWSMVRLIY